MSWIRRNPFADGVNPTAHMLALIVAESDRAGTPLDEAEKQMLLAPWDPETVVSEDFENKAKRLIRQTFDYEADPDSPVSLGNSVQWAGEQGYPMIVALTEEVMFERGEKSELRGRRWIIDRIHLVGCGFVAVILLTLFAALVSRFFGHAW